MASVNASKDDLRQAAVIAVNEIRKFVSAKRFRVYILLVVAVVALMTLLPYILGDGLSGSSGSVFSNYISYASFIVMLGATLFASSTLVSEFEERTALILFTRPIRRRSIFLGKLAACFALVAVVMAAYYLVAVAIAYCVGGELVTSFLPSLAMCLLFAFAASGLGMLISSVSKKAGTAAIVTFIAVLLILPVVSTAVSASGTDTWFMLDTAMESIVTSIPEYVAEHNQSIEGMMEFLGMPFLEGMMVEAADCLRSGAVMLAWGVATTVLAFLAFSRREF